MDKIIKLAAIALLASSSLCHAAEGLLVAQDSGKAVLVVSGDLQIGDDRRIAAMVDRFGADNITGTVLTGNGGDVETAFRLSDLINIRIGKPVHVASECLSACAFIALAASDRLVVTGDGELKVHQVWVKNGQADLKLTRRIADWLRDCGVPESILNKIITTVPDDMAAVTTKELRAMGARVD